MSYLVKPHHNEVINSVFSQYIQDRSDKNFTSLYNITKPHIYAVVRYLVKDVDQTDDIVSECYVLMMKKIDSYNGINFLAWFYKLARNLTYDYLANKVGFSTNEDLYRKRYKVDFNKKVFGDGGSDSEANDKAIFNDVESLYSDMLFDEPNECFEIDINEIKDFIVNEYLESLSELDRRLLIEKFIKDRKYTSILEDEYFSGLAETNIRLKVFHLKKSAKNFYNEYLEILKS